MELMHGLKTGENTVFLPVAVDGEGRLVVAVAADSLGVAATGVAPAAGASGLIGWLSSIVSTLRAALTVQGSTRTCLGREVLPVTTGAVATLQSIPAGAVAAFIQADGNTVRLTLDGGTNPTAAIGTRLDDGVIFPVDTPLASVKLIAQSGACNVQVSYFNKP
jgi:hypothetical protein